MLAPTVVTRHANSKDSSAPLMIVRLAGARRNTFSRAGDLR